MKPSVKVGLIGGASILIIFLILFFIKPEGVFSKILQYGIFVVLLASVYVAVKKQRDELGGKIDFIHALRTGISTALIVSLFFAICAYISVVNVDVYGEIDGMKKAGLSTTTIANNLERMTSSANIVIQSIMAALTPLLLGCMGAIGAAVIMTKRS
ncbi:MAG: DUF4199 family protein [Bacteroidia bacterium]